MGEGSHSIITPKEQRNPRGTEFRWRNVCRGTEQMSGLCCLREGTLDDRPVMSSGTLAGTQYTRGGVRGGC